MHWIEVILGILVGSSVTYIVMDLRQARETDWLSDRIKKCTLQAVQSDALHLLDTFSDSELVAAVKSGGLDSLIEKRRAELSKLHPELRSEQKSPGSDG